MSRQIEPVGNMVVGKVSEIGEAVTSLQIGDAVFGYGPICEVHQAPAEHWYRLGNLSPTDAVCVDPAHVAFVAVRDGNIRIGDDVTVFWVGCDWIDGGTHCTCSRCKASLCS